MIKKDPNFMREIGRKGGKAVVKNHGIAHMKKLSKRAHKMRWKNKDATHDK